MIALIANSAKPSKKYDVYLIYDGKTKKISFGASGYEDYTIHHNNIRRHLYDNRHKSEDWDNPLTAGFWAKHLLWNKKTIKKSADDITAKFGIDITLAL